MSRRDSGRDRTRDRGDRTRDPVGLRAPQRRWGTWLERLLLALPIVVATGVLGVVGSAPGSALRGGVVVAVAVALVGLRVTIPVCLYLDATEQSRSSVRWNPNRQLYAATALSISASLVALVYLYRRYDLVALPEPRRHWWLAVALAAFVAPVSLTVGLADGGVDLVTTLAVGTVLAAVLLPVGLVRDAAHVAGSDGHWRPNPALYLGFAYVALLVVVLQPALAAYYLGRRSREGP